MTNAPAHAAEHNTLMQLIAKIVNQSALIDTVILITVGVDGRPSIGGNVDHPGQIMEILQQLAAAEEDVEGVRRVDLPKDN